MFGGARNYILLPMAACWLAAMGALFLHPALWALFVVLLCFFTYQRWTKRTS